ncbi:hypothetical protein V8D89_001423 [Ganoderma adspersum]
MSTATNSSTFPEIPVENTLGAWVFTVASDFLLNGILFHQAYRYFREYGDDQRFIKIWVAIVIVMQTFLSALVLHTAWFYLIQLYWEPAEFFLQGTVWSLNLIAIAGPMTALCSQTFFVRRLWLLAPKFKIIAASIFILNVANAGCFTALSVKMFQTTRGVHALDFSWLASIAVSIQMAGDIILMLALIYVFRKSRTGIGRTDSMLEVMIAYAIGTGAVNCVGHMFTVVFSIVYPHNWIYGMFSSIDAKLYANGFLVALDSRKFLNMARYSSDVSTPRGLSNWNISSSGPRSGNPMTNGTTNPTTIELKVVTEMVSDEPDEAHSKWHGPATRRSVA